MKTSKLDLKKKILIVELSKRMEYLLHKDELHFLLDGIHLHEIIYGKYNLICEGSELTEEICETLISKKDVAKNQSKMCGLKFKEGFINMVKENGYYWCENPIQNPNNIVSFPKSGIVYEKSFEKYKEGESRTFNPEKTLIFEIL